MCKGIYALHSYGILHKRIHPRNLLLDANDDLKVADAELEPLYGHPSSYFDDMFKYFAP